MGMFAALKLRSDVYLRRRYFLGAVFVLRDFWN
jgi:hypothetical protein